MSFVILLESDAERAAHVKETLVPQLPRWEIISATELKNIDAREYCRREKIQIEIGDFGELNRNKVACTISHWRVWREIVKRKLSHAIVFEDDISIRTGFFIFIKTLIKSLPADYDLVHLYVHIDHDNFEHGKRLFDEREWVERYRDDYPCVRFCPIWGRSAYLLSRNGAEKLISAFRKLTRIEGDMQIAELGREGQLSVFSASKIYVDNLGQATREYAGERFRSNIH